MCVSPRSTRAHEREGKAGEVGAAADAADDHVGLLAGELHLQRRLLPDHGLVQQHVVQHGAERVVGVIARGGHLDGLGDRDPERARGVGRCWARPDSVSVLGERCTLAPQVCIIERR